MEKVPLGKGKNAADKRHQKQQQVFQKIMGLKNSKSQFRDPAMMMPKGGESDI